MTATIHVLHPSSAPIAGFLRVGHTGHCRLEALHAEGRFRYRRVVFDAAHIVEQHSLLKTLRESGCEIVLDPNFAEMSVPGRFGSAVSKLPWANPNRPWQPIDFERGRNLDPAKAIAEFAVEHGVNVVLAPCHLIEPPISASWRPVDLVMCEALRSELDRRGATNIAIDYQIITTNAVLKDDKGRQALIDGVGRLLIDNIWIRVSGFGATATGVGTRHFIESVRCLLDVKKPVIADNVGGFPGLAAAAFGAIGGLSHGVSQKESFDASDWKRPSKAGGGGAKTRTYVRELDRYFTEDQLNVIFAARGGRSRFGCKDTACCQHGTEDMIENAQAHFLAQRSDQIEDISNVPELRRAEHFLLRHLDPAVRSARFGAGLRIADEDVARALSKAKKRLIRLRDALADLQANEGTPLRSLSPAFRGGARSISAVLGN